MGRICVVYQGLDLCQNLEELSLEHNCITRIEGISKLTNLVTLMLGHNYIQSLENSGLDKLLNLQYLSIESNRWVYLQYLLMWSYRCDVHY